MISDERNHASLIDGIRLSPARREIFAHNDVAAMRRAIESAGRASDPSSGPLRAESRGECFVVVESLFSMDGDEAPLADYAEICEATGAHLIVDEAHAVGVYGERGSGLIEEQGVGDRVFLSVNTAGKALGVSGAFVAGPAWAIDYVIQRARPFIFSTAPPPALASALDASLDWSRRSRSGVRPCASAPRLCARGCWRPVSPSRRAHRTSCRCSSAATMPPWPWPTRCRPMASTCAPSGRPASPRHRKAAHLGECQSDGRCDRAMCRIARVGMSKGFMFRGIFVTGTDTNVGKTVVSAALMVRYRDEAPLRYWKPIQTGIEHDDDTAEVARLAAAPWPTRRSRPRRPAAASRIAASGRASRRHAHHRAVARRDDVVTTSRRTESAPPWRSDPLDCRGRRRRAGADQRARDDGRSDRARWTSGAGRGAVDAGHDQSHPADDRGSAPPDAARRGRGDGRAIRTTRTGSRSKSTARRR